MGFLEHQAEMSRCPNCNYNFGFVPKWEPGDKCPNCNYAPPAWLWYAMGINCLIWAYIAYLIAATYFKNKVVIGIIMCVSIVVSIVVLNVLLALAKERFGWFKNIK